MKSPNPAEPLTKHIRAYGQNKLARETDISKATISRIVNGTSGVTAAKLERIAEQLGVVFVVHRVKK